MKKLLLFALIMGISAISFAQDGKISVDAYIDPSGTITTEDPANGSTLIQVTVTNNESTYTYPANQTQFNFNVKLDGNLIDNPAAPATKEFIIPILADLAPGASVDLILATNWGPDATPGTHSLCVDLLRAVVTTAVPPIIANTDQNKEFCQDFNFQWPVGINDLNSSEISKIKTEGDLMTIFVKNTSNVTEVKLMSITGQIVKTVTSSNGGQDFNESFDISNLTSGVYIVSVQSENGATQAQKVFVQ